MHQALRIFLCGRREGKKKKEKKKKEKGGGEKTNSKINR